ncbi:unnamed protein product [Lepeophtheirus salmonis]|uniref:(salmon louse) hypothetical protein n=1 Tax=Lepeophtheirus salmonis TaxID=72036 RepID=A0A7R8CNA6_LEPSM|nr:unnamed protein product [Lepeophtheirus salmonis]CAF2844434.1 unnamed protein product [Lepeophtheirus salmonis]
MDRQRENRVKVFALTDMELTPSAIAIAKSTVYRIKKRVDSSSRIDRKDGDDCKSKVDSKISKGRTRPSQRSPCNSCCKIRHPDHDSFQGFKKKHPASVISLGFLTSSGIHMPLIEFSVEYCLTTADYMPKIKSDLIPLIEEN